MGSETSALMKQQWFLPRIEAVMRAGLEVDEEKLLAEFCRAHASTRRTALEYLNQLITLNLVVRKDGKLWTPDAISAQKVLESIENHKQPAPANAIEVTK